MGVIKTLLVALLCLLSVEAQAARGFDTTMGVGTTDEIQSGLSYAWPSKFSASAWIWINGSGGGTKGRIWDNNNSGVGANEDILFMNSASNSMAFQSGFSINSGTFNWTAPSTGAWHSIVVTYDGTSVSNTPIVYLDGSSVSVTTGTAPVGTVNTSSITLEIGNRTDGTRVWDGKMADMAFWSAQILTANEVKSLSQGTSPLKIEPAALTLYLPLDGYQSGEPDWGPSHGTQTLTGTKYQNNPKLSGSPFMRNPN